jgi:hypothetical protein
MLPILMLGGCAALGGKNLSPELTTDLNLGIKSEIEAEQHMNQEGRGDNVAGGVAGRIGGDGDSIALWMSIGVLGLIALTAYPAQRSLRLAWNSWRGKSSPRSDKGRDVCIKFSEWDSSP